ncbi:DNA-directed RNA polymerase II polypeptide [Capsaspora owczarzaki ATCC 30864]|uniref:DNA-directed RNA polymerase subunit n=1 Tax=Capsaspora owczarzaki (strain ATCC 30864) TaxID=595528 RepID=A0A0D2US74_CAPO3|nr:DNA-directed RNA polymerase II polypeptide [Capsaspora owczarzaki ATCC 30864]
MTLNSNNMLYPAEDRSTSTLMYRCRNCDSTEEAESSRVYLHSNKQSMKDDVSRILSDVAMDPTLPRTHDQPCAKCGQAEAVFFQAQMRRATSGMQNFYVCCNCGERWSQT